MRKKVGLWIDHKEAIIIAITDKGEEIELIPSEVERQLRRSGDSPLKGPYDVQQVPTDSRRLRTFTEHLNAYYDSVIAAINDAKSILIFGPGEAKVELKKRFEKNNLGENIVGIEAADKMTENQIAAKVRQHFAK